MYECPITEIQQKLSQKIAEENDKMILEEVRKVGIVVDKDELIKALRYDRDQYIKGYNDGCDDIIKRINEDIEKLKSEGVLNMDVVLYIIKRYAQQF